VTDYPTSRLAQAASLVRSGAMSASDLVEASLHAIARHQSRTNAFTRVAAESARAAAAAADAEIAAGRVRGPLHGVPLSIKDLIDVRGEVTSAGSRVLRDRVADRDAVIVTRLHDAGAVLIGRTNLHEFALGTTSDDSAFGAVHHPADPSRSAGGSSGGSAVAVATGMGLASIGTDTGGSIRIPAAACGIVGLKPSFGEVPTDGVIPLSPSFDHVGPLASSVEDAGLVWAVLAAQPLPALVPPPMTHIRLARLRGHFDAPVAPDVREAFERALETLAEAGATITASELPSAAAIAQAYVDVVLPEGAAWHARYLDTRAADYSPTVRARFQSGRAISAVSYLAAQEFRRTLRREVDAVLADADAIVLPTLPILAPGLGETDVTIDPAVGDRTPVRAAMLRHTQPFNLTGHPAISLPVATSGLPVGIQIVGRLGDTPGLLAIAAACEKMVG
jgi:aspartyl-tRNA(Asn)/glutamyl-tRNA(Gln) amidotransferase subunit A